MTSASFPLTDSRSEDPVVPWLANPIFAAAGPAVCEQLAVRYAPRAFPAKSILIHEGEPADHLHVLLAGTAQIFHRSAAGLELVVKLVRAPMVFGEIQMLHGLCFMEYVRAIDPVRLAKIPAQDYTEFLLAHPLAMLEHFRHVAACFCVAVRNQQSLFADLEQRMAHLLVSYAHFYGAPKGDQVAIACRLSQLDIAQSLGATRRSVAQIMSSWARKPLVCKKNGRFILVNPDALAQLAAPLKGGLCYQMGTPLDALEEGGWKGLGRLFVEVVGGPDALRGRRLAIHDDLTIGRDPSCELPVSDELLSQRHCRIFRGRSRNRFWLEDLRSLNGTLINDRPLARRAVLRHDDQIKVGSLRLVAQYEDSASASPWARRG